MGIEEQFVYLAIGWVFVFVRIYVRVRQIGGTGWKLDDYLMPLASVRHLPLFQFCFVSVLALLFPLFPSWHKYSKAGSDN